jgi:hypothetical protein
MGLFSPFVYENKNGKKFWLHAVKKGKMMLYFFSKDPRASIKSLPKGYAVVENPTTGFPFLKKKAGGMLGGLFKKVPEKKVLGETSGSTQKGA